MEHVDCTVIGGGVIGLAIAAQLSKTRSVLLLEKENALGQGVSSRNSEVIHSGIYYPQHSLKAKLCVEGRKQLYAFCEAYNVPFKKTGKLVVAQQSEKSSLEKIYQQALNNGVDGCEWLEKSDIKKLEPAIQADYALYCSQSGIVDSHALMQALEGVISNNGSTTVLDSEVGDIKTVELKPADIKTEEKRAVDGSTADRKVISVNVIDGKTAKSAYNIQLANGFEFLSSALVVAAGLNSWSLAEKVLNNSNSTWRLPKRYLAKGHYFSYNAKSPFQHLIYPAPEKAGLGIHATLDLGGQIKFGPDVEYVNETDAENYQFDDDISTLKQKFVNAIKKYYPGVNEQNLQPAYVGIRPKLQSPEQNFADFLIAGESEHQLKNAVFCLGIESPGLTSALAIAKHVAARLEEQHD